MKKLQVTLLALISCIFLTPLAALGSTLSPTEEADLLFMREEEKLARDVYITMDGLWQKKIFSNIADSEQRHMDAMLNMIERYELTDPVGDNGVGEFTDNTLATLYDNLTEQGSKSLLEGLRAGAFIEETDIRDISDAISNTDEQPLIQSYGNLLAGSRNHLRAFVGHIEKMGYEYEPVILSKEEFGAIMEGAEDAPVAPDNFSINAGLNDAWFYPDTAGQGFVLTVFPGVKKVFFVWFTYDAVFPPDDSTAVIGDPDQRWLAAQGSYTGAMAELQVSSMRGGLFDQEEPAPTGDPRGSILLQFENCNSGSVTYDLITAEGSLHGYVPIQRINSDNVARCEQLGKAGQD